MILINSGKLNPKRIFEKILQKIKAEIKTKTKFDTRPNQKSTIWYGTY